MIEHDKCKYIDDRSFHFFLIKFARTSACKFLVNNDRFIPKGQTKYIINIAILVRQLNGRTLTSSNWLLNIFSFIVISGHFVQSKYVDPSFQSHTVFFQLCYNKLQRKKIYRYIEKNNPLYSFRSRYKWSEYPVIWRLL